jgi:hypothetical protein
MRKPVRQSPARQAIPVMKKIANKQAQCRQENMTASLEIMRHVKRPWWNVTAKVKLSFCTPWRHTEEERYSSTHSLTSVLDTKLSASRLRRFTPPRKEPAVGTVQEAAWGHMVKVTALKQLRSLPWIPKLWCVFSWRYLHRTSGFRRDVDEISTLLGYYAAPTGNPLPTFRDNVSVPSSRISKSKKKRTSWLLEAGLIRCPETLVYYHSTLRNIPQERRCYLHKMLPTLHTILSLNSRIVASKSCEKGKCQATNFNQLWFCILMERQHAARELKLTTGVAKNCISRSVMYTAQYLKDDYACIT